MMPSTSSERIDAAHRELTAQATAESSTNKLKLGSGALQGDRLHADSMLLDRCPRRWRAEQRRRAAQQQLAYRRLARARHQVRRDRSASPTKPSSGARRAKSAGPLRPGVRRHARRTSDGARRSSSSLLGARREPGTKFGEIVRLHQRNQARARGAPSQPARCGPAYDGARGAPAGDDAQRGADVRCAILSPGPFAVAAGQTNGGGGLFLRSPASGQE